MHKDDKYNSQNDELAVCACLVDYETRSPLIGIIVLDA